MEEFLKVLLVSSRFPWPPYSGDRLRTTIWMEALAPHCDVTLVAPEGRVPANTPCVSHYAATRSWLRGLQAIAKTLRDSRPFQTLLTAPRAWDVALKRAEREQGPFDVTVVILARVEPSVRGLLPQGRRILDAIDALSRNMEERARKAGPLTRWIWQIERARTARAEQAAALAYDRILFVSEDEALAAGVRGVALSNGIVIKPLETRSLDSRPVEVRPRRYDFGFWGRLAYFANADAAHWLLEEIWPAIRAQRPESTLVIAGAAASPSLRRAARRAGVTLLSPIADMSELARDVRIALLPVRYGSGESTKMLEAAEAGCAVVSTSLGVRSLTSLAGHALIADDAAALARAAVDLLVDTGRQSRLASELRRIVAERYDRRLTLDRMAELVRKDAA